MSKWCKISVSGIYTYYITLWHQALFTPNSKSLKGCEMSVPVIYTYCTPLRHQALYTPNSISLRGVWRECIWDLHQLNTTLTPDSIYSIWSHDNKFKRGVKWVYVGFTPIIRNPFWHQASPIYSICSQDCRFKSSVKRVSNPFYTCFTLRIVVGSYLVFHKVYIKCEVKNMKIKIGIK